MDITMLGTGNAMVTECYNTCFVLRDGDKHLLVDGGGGNTLLAQLKHAGFDWMDMREIFVTHKHVDHIMGVVWMIRMICQHMKQGQYEGEATIYGHEEVIRILKEMAEMLYPKKQFEAFCSDIGMSMTTAFCVFAKKAVRERRIPFEITADSDPFYSPTNIARLKKSIEQLETTGGTIHEVNMDDKSMV